MIYVYIYSTHTYTYIIIIKIIIIIIIIIIYIYVNRDSIFQCVFIVPLFKCLVCFIIEQQPLSFVPTARRLAVEF